MESKENIGITREIFLGQSDDVSSTWYLQNQKLFICGAYLG